MEESKELNAVISGIIRIQDKAVDNTIASTAFIFLNFVLAKKSTRTMPMIHAAMTKKDIVMLTLSCTL